MLLGKVHPSTTVPTTIAHGSPKQGYTPLMHASNQALVLMAVAMIAGATWVIAIPTSSADSLSSLDRYNVVWTSPSKSAAGSMPIGNGEVGVNVWVEEGGDLLLLISRTDSWSETCRLMKLCRLRVKLDPNPFAQGAAFRQALTLRDGRIQIEAGDAKLEVFVDSNAPVVWVTGASTAALKIEAKLETWRTADKKELKGQELDSSWTVRASPKPVFESGDHFAGEPGAVEQYHRNDWSVVPATLEHQGLGSVAGAVKDPLIGRTFGSRLSARGFRGLGSDAIGSPGRVKRFALQIVAHCAQTPNAAEWLTQTRAIARANSGHSTALRRTTAWWRAFWNRSWIFVANDASQNPIREMRISESPGLISKTQSPQSSVSEGYILQRYVQACGGRGSYPIKFNGSIFTVEPEAMGIKQDPDWRRWGDCFWWQNTRFPYHAMLASGDFEMMEPLWRLYEEALPLCEARAKLYHGVRGGYFPETMTIFGTYANGDYGWDRFGHQSNEVLCPWWQYAWNQGPELLALMLDRYDYTVDPKFLRTRIEPMARSVLSYFSTRFTKDAKGKLRISPTQAVETYWNDVVNDTPTISGLHEALTRLAVSSANRSDQSDWSEMLRSLVPIPIKDGKIQAAESFDSKRSNVENPELYAIWPFRLYGVGRTELAIAQKTFLERPERANAGWQYDGQAAALCGLTAEAKASLLAKCANSNPAYRWPATWGPNYDWLPDQCHGSNLMLTLQLMLLQPVGQKLYLFPAWPREWDVKLKLHAPGRTLVEAELRDGKLASLKVTPKARAKDVVLPEPLR